MNLKLVLLSSALLAISACNKEEKKAEVASKTKEKKNCIYSIESSKVNWTAYKFTEKVGVGGSFDSVKTLAPSQSINPVKALENASVEIKASSVNSNLALRDERIQRLFFNPLVDSGNIRAIVKELGPNGSGTLVVVLNGIEKEVKFQSEYKEALTLKANLNTSDFNAQSSIAALNEECKDVHRGKDGKSVLWPDVSVEVEFALAEKCGE
jgi:hypothetical protein